MRHGRVCSLLMVLLLAGSSSLLAQGLPSVTGKSESSGPTVSVGTVIAYGDNVSRWQPFDPPRRAQGREPVERRDNVSVIDLRGTVVISRGANRLMADRAVIWINETASTKAGVVVMECYAAGNVVTSEQGALIESQEVFFSWKVPALALDDGDGRISVLSAPKLDSFMRRAQFVRSHGGISDIPALQAFIGPRHKARPTPKRPPYAKAPELQPMRFGSIYAQKLPMPEITVRREGDYTVTTATKCPDIVFIDPDPNMGQLEVLADNIVVWMNEVKMDQTGDVRKSDMQIYAEGHVVVHHRGRTLRCEKLFYDYSRQRAMIVGGPAGYAVIRGHHGELQIPYYYHAKVFRQLSRDNYRAENARITTSEFGHPEWYVWVHHMNLDIGRQMVPDASGRLEEEVVSEKATFYHSVFTARGVPLAYLPVWSRDLRREKTLLKRLIFGSSSNFGTEVRTGWDLYALGIYDNDWSEALLLLDYLSDRGLGHGLEVAYARAKYSGSFHGYHINDTGEDFDGIPLDRKSRGRARWFHRHLLSENWRLDFEVSYYSDANFLNEYFEQEFKEGKSQETLAYLHYTRENFGFTMLGKWRINDFTTDVESLPEARALLIGRPIFGNRLVYSTDNRLGFLKRRQDDRIAGPPGDYDSFRFDTYHELQLPLAVGPVKVAPFAGVRYTHYGEDALGESNNRTLLTAGVRTSARLWKLYDVHNRLWDLNGIRHVIVPSVDYMTAFDSTTPAAELLQFDYVDALDEFEVVRFGLHQRVQTKRPCRRRVPTEEADWRVVDWMLLYADIDFYPDADRDNGGRDWSDLVLQYEFRVTDRVTFLADAEIDIDDDKRFETTTVGFSLNRSPRLSLYLGQRYIRGGNSNISIGRLEYTVDERWKIGLLGEYDWKTGQSDNVRITIARILHDWEMRVGMERDAGEDETSFTLELVPVWAPKSRLRIF